MFICHAIAALLILSIWASHVSAAHLWWEAESPAETNFPARSAFSPETFPDTRDRLSAGNWLSISGRRGASEPFARYSLEIPADGEYALWVRKFWKHGPFRWRFGTDGPWQSAGRDVALVDDVPLRTHLNANWVHLGQVTLSKGKTTFEIRLIANPGDELVAAFDCLLLTQEPFIPAGKLQPGQRTGTADEGFFAYEPAADPFTDDALLDLRYLNEPVAGQNGFVRREGDQFVLGDGTPVRFFALNLGSNISNSNHQAIDYMARRLAKSGVNMVRFHSQVFRMDRPDPTVDAKTLDGLHYLVSALKKQGIYTTISFYFPLWFDMGDGSGIRGYSTIQNRKPFALIYFQPEFQAIYKAGAEKILTAPNPYTGTSLAKDPAVAMVELVNEDSFFFWTFTKKNVPAPQWRMLEQQFSQWLGRRHGSVAKAFQAWNNARIDGDDPDADHAALYEAWHMTTDGLRQGGRGKRLRVSDQVRFLTETQRAFYEQMTSHFKQRLGVGGLIAASNWTVSDPAKLYALEQYTYTAADVIDQHGYFDSPHEGEGSSYSVRVGHTIRDRAAVLEPQNVPLRFKQVSGRPHVISELGWPAPNRFRSDATFLASAYASLQGVDGLYFFTITNVFLRDMSVSKFQASGPAIFGAMPATALQYRRGDVATGSPVLVRNLGLEDMFAMKGEQGAVVQNLDQLRAGDAPGNAPRVLDDRTEALAFFVGPVVRTFDEPIPSPVVDLSRYISADKVRSVTDQLEWDTKLGVVTVNTPASQGACGFLSKKGRIELGAVTIDCRNEYAAILVIALDDRPLVTSRKILIQAVTEDRPFGWKVQDGRITDLGTAPLGVRQIDATITLRLQGDAPIQVQALDENGYGAARKVRLTGTASEYQVQLSPDSLYHVLTR